MLLLFALLAIDTIKSLLSISVTIITILLIRAKLIESIKSLLLITIL